MLELIADAGEKLGGEYIFDIQYLKTLSAELETAVRNVVYDLNVVSNNRYSKFNQVLSGIDAKVRAALQQSQGVVRQTAFVIPVAQVDEELSDAVGSKMGRLGEIRKRLGCRVPDGFVISACACQRFLEQAGVGDLEEQFGPDAATDAWLADKSAAIQERIRRASLSKELERDLRRELAALKKRTPGWRVLAVRSSALDEDGPRSFAGQY